jgi:L-lactate dehydrogenase
LKDAEICILSSGDPPVEGDTEDSFLSRNVDIVRQKGDLLRDSGFRGVLIVTTHPAEIMAQVAMEASGLGSESVIGIGPNSVSNLALTTDRRLPVATWCSAAGCDVEHVDSCHPDCPYFEDMLERFHSYQRSADRGRPASMANCVTRICEAIFNDEKAVLPVAALLKGEHAIMGTFSSVPCVIGKRGIEKVLELPLSDVERKDLLDTARETGRLFYRLTKRALAVSNGNRA